MRKLIVCLLPCFCLVAFAAPSPFAELRGYVEARVASIAGSTDKHEAAEWKALTKALGYIVEADAISLGMPVGPPTVDSIPDFLDFAALLPKAAAGIEKSETPDADILGSVATLHTFFTFFHGWIGYKFDEIIAGLPAKDQAKIIVARAKAEDVMGVGETQWSNGDWGAATKTFAKAVKSLAKLLVKYSA